MSSVPRCPNCQIGGSEYFVPSKVMPLTDPAMGMPGRCKACSHLSVDLQWIQPPPISQGQDIFAEMNRTVDDFVEECRAKKFDCMILLRAGDGSSYQLKAAAPSDPVVSEGMLGLLSQIVRHEIRKKLSGIFR